jgi:hypothetical protein
MHMGSEQTQVQSHQDSKSVVPLQFVSALWPALVFQDAVPMGRLTESEPEGLNKTFVLYVDD